MQRPNPDLLLQQLKREEALQQRGKLTIFFGACAGVGKTYAMLKAAELEQQQGRSVLIGIVETHGRQGTIHMAAPFEILPRKTSNYKDKQLFDFDLDAALSRAPDLILVDELAHTNLAGSRHAKRWQDIQELLAAGIDVYTTVNVQHLESLNDVVSQITGIRVWETVPDHVFDQADAINLVDLPPDELLRRLNQGKIYLAPQAQRASQHFFRKGNLIALRELALRRTADHVDGAMRDYREHQSIQGVWQAKERLLVCVGDDDSAPRLIRGAARLANNLKADWIAVSVEAAPTQSSKQDHTKQSNRALQLAQELGAETTKLAGQHLADLLLSYARSRNVSKIVLGRSRKTAWQRLWKSSLAAELAQRSTDIDIVVIAHDLASFEETNHTTSPSRTIAAVDTAPASRPSIHRSVSADSNHFDDLSLRRTPKTAYLWTIAACLGTTLMSASLIEVFDLVNVVMFYLITIVAISVRFGRNPAILASFLSVASFDFFFVPPRFSFSVSDGQYLITFAVMLIISLVISRLTSNLRFQAQISLYRERRTEALYKLSKALSAALSTEQIVDIAIEHLAPAFHAHIAILLSGRDEKVQDAIHSQHDGALNDYDLSVAQWVFDNQQAAGAGTNTLPSQACLYLPLRAPTRIRGVLLIRTEKSDELQLADIRQWLDSCIAQIALAVERVHYVEIAQEVMLSMETERLRNSLLSALSHDLRTPLTSIVGLASTLHAQTGLSSEKQSEISQAIHDEALRMNGLVVNLLDMARLRSGKVQLNLEWQPIEEVIGSALRSCKHSLQDLKVELKLQNPSPLIHFDAVLIERVLCNLLENAAQYGGKQIQLSTTIEEQQMVLSIDDDGRGLPAGINIFEKFSRGENESNSSGVGLGLAICESILMAHGGKIWAENRYQGDRLLGARFRFSLPIGSAPDMHELDTDSAISHPKK
ncbi:sensor histidine kinase KdpD [Undibacterium cyanobacteriorum]|uniref:histidine kinase n=1 Tax=Undibacterium cyanobacteriorum TaxID=3073561 RepID=A0ABY9RNK0_9BURK|nr:sensor histidine kinase KdpD [Undibacterium sp. 20NA77.5]WMW81865.1 sensor histidine kinase KdpD [Undibacterium sp. 20NA77.5]